MPDEPAPMMQTLGSEDMAFSRTAVAVSPRSLRLDWAPMVLALSDFAATFGLLVTFLGIGVIVTGIVVYIAVQVLGERAENRRPSEGPGAERAH